MLRAAKMRDVAETHMRDLFEAASAEDYRTCATDVLSPAIVGLAATGDRIWTTVPGKVRTSEHDVSRGRRCMRCIVGTR